MDHGLNRFTMIVSPVTRECRENMRNPLSAESLKKVSSMFLPHNLVTNRSIAKPRGGMLDAGQSLVGNAQSSHQSTPMTERLSMSLTQNHLEQINERCH